MAKFSDIPYFLIVKYFDMLNDYKTNKTFDVSSSVSLFPEVRFKNTNETEFINRDQVYFNKTLDINTYVNDSYLIGPKTTLVSKGDSVIELFVKKETYGYKKFQITLDSITDNLFKVIKNNQINIESEGTDYEVIEGNDYSFKIYDLQDEITSIEDGESVYFRKDSPFYEWVITYAEDVVNEEYNVKFDLRNYINFDKPFIYFGQIFKLNHYDNKYNISYYAMKDFVGHSIPPHQLTDKFKTLIDLNFDVLYNEIYSLQKNIYSLIDPIEIDIKYLNQLTSICGFNIDDFDIDEFNKRSFADELINILKKKGTYTSLWSIWKLLTNNKCNIHFYDKWHDKSITGDVGDNYESYPWLGYYNKTNLEEDSYFDKWTNKYYPDSYPENQNTKILSTHYTVEIDLTKEPVHETEIFNESLADKIYTYWETFRPINRVADYNMFISPIVDLSTKEIELFNPGLTAYMKSKCSIKDVVLPNTFIYMLDGKGGDTEVTITHNLGSKYINIQLFTFDLQLIYPDEIIYIDNNSVKIILSSEETICVLIKKSIFIKTQEIKNDSNISDKYIQSLFTENDIVTIPDTFNVIDENTVNLIPTLNGAYSTHNYVYVQNTPSYKWTVVHELNIDEVLVNMYDLNNNKIYPDRIELLNEYSLNIHFNTPITGYAVITQTDENNIYYSVSPVNNWTIEHNINRELLNVQVYSINMDEIIPTDIIFNDNNTLTISLDVAMEIFVVIRESNNDPNYTDDWTIKHNLNQQYIFSQFSNLDDCQIIPNKIELVDENTLKTDLSNGISSISKNDVLFVNFTPSSEWTITHNLGYSGILINTYNSDNVKIYSESVTSIDDNSIKINFDSDMTGYAIIIPIGSPTFFEILQSNEVTFTETDSNNTYETTIDELWDDDDFVYFTINIPKEITMTINKIEIFNEDKILFETNNSNLFKPNTMSMNVFYRISKEIL